MKKTINLSVIAASVIVLLTTSVFADSRPQDRTWRDRDDRYSRDRDGRYDSGRGYRDNERVTVRGRVSSFTRERDGYRVFIDGGRHAYWVPSQRLRGRDLRVGIVVSIGGIFRAGTVYVDDLGWPDDYGYRDNRGYRDEYVRGIVDRIDYRRNVIALRDEYSGRYVTVDMDRLQRDYRGVDLNDLRRGDFVALAGQWVRANIFEAYRVESFRAGR